MTKPILEERKTVCLCSVLGSVFSFGKIFGFSPFTYVHEGNFCRFEKSSKWFSIISLIDVILLVSIIYFFKFDVLFKRNEITVLLSYITDLIYDLYYVELIFFNLYSHSSWIRTLNELNKLMQKGVICKSVLDLQNKLQKRFIYFFILVLLLYGLVLIYLMQSDYFKLSLKYFQILEKMLQSFVFMFYIFFFTFLTLITSALNCFYKMSFVALKYKRIYPMKTILGTSNQQDFLIFITYEACREDHGVPDDFEKKSNAEMLEFFRLFHGEITRIIEHFNECFNPQLLIHTTVEILMLVVNWYSVIIGFAYRFNDPQYGSGLVLNLTYSVLHTVGLFSFLRNSQQLSDTVSFNTFIFFCGISLVLSISNI